MIDTRVQLIGAKETLNELRNVQPTVFKQMRDDIKSITSPAVDKIQSNLPKVSPLTHAVHNGRSAFSANIKVSTSVTPGARASSGTEAKLVQIVVRSKDSYGFELMDMAGRGGWIQRLNVTRPYQRNGKTRTHRINGQQSGMKKKLGSNRGSRYVYPAAESMIPAMAVEVSKAIDKATLVINRKLDRI